MSPEWLFCVYWCGSPFCPHLLSCSAAFVIAINILYLVIYDVSNVLFLFCTINVKYVVDVWTLGHVFLFFWLQIVPKMKIMGVGMWFFCGFALWNVDYFLFLHRKKIANGSCLIHSIRFGRNISVNSYFILYKNSSLWSHRRSLLQYHSLRNIFS